eukprot:12745780-Ditylum_brightwellii.AAC.1
MLVKVGTQNVQYGPNDRKALVPLGVVSCVSEQQLYFKAADQKKERREGNTSDHIQRWKAIQKAGATMTRKDCKKENQSREDAEAKKSP